MVCFFCNCECVANSLSFPSVMSMLPCALPHSRCNAKQITPKLVGPLNKHNTWTVNSDYAVVTCSEFSFLPCDSQQV